MSAHDATLDLRELALKGGERVERRVSVEIAPLTLGGLRYDVLVDGGEARVSVARVTGGFLVRVSVGAVVYGPCFRCLRDVSIRVDAVEEEFVPRDPAEWSPEDISPFVQDLVVDVGALARESVVLTLPSKLLCREECPGLCPSCGAELTRGPCGCETTPSDPRWDKLKDLGREQGPE